MQSRASHSGLPVSRLKDSASSARRVRTRPAISRSSLSRSADRHRTPGGQRGSCRGHRLSDILRTAFRYRAERRESCGIISRVDAVRASAPRRRCKWDAPAGPLPNANCRMMPDRARLRSTMSARRPEGLAVRGAFHPEAGELARNRACPAGIHRQRSMERLSRIRRSGRWTAASSRSMVAAGDRSARERARRGRLLSERIALRAAPLPAPGAALRAGLPEPDRTVDSRDVWSLACLPGRPMPP